MVSRYFQRERRKYRRIKNQCVILSKLSFPAKSRAALKNKEFNAIMLDLSTGGLAFFSRNKIPKRALVKNKFVLIGDIGAKRAARLKLIEAGGRVCYSLLTAKGIYRIGLEFAGPSGDIRSFLDSNKKEK